MLKAISTASSSDASSSDSKVSSSSATYVSRHIKHLLWHKRFGHLTKDIVNIMMNSSLLSLLVEDHTVYEACLLGKFKKLPFPNSESTSLNL